MRLFRFALLVILHKFEGNRTFSASASEGTGSLCCEMWLRHRECDFALFDHSRTSFPLRTHGYHVFTRIWQFPVA